MSRTFRAKTENKNLWAGLGTQYTSISQVVNEFVDNSISNFKGHPELNSNSIIVTLEEIDKKTVKISVEDSGTGISDFANAFGIGAKSCQDSPLNEHGFGMKQALAAGNPDNDSWKLCTRSDKNSKTYDEVSAPYCFDKDMVIDDSKTDWPGDGLGITGTYVEFICSNAFFKTVARGLKGGHSNFMTLSALLYEDLGFTYSGIISSLSVSMKLKVIELGKAPAIYTLSALKPNQKGLYSPGTGAETVTLDAKTNEYRPDPSGELTIHYEFLEVNKKESPKKNDLFNNTTANKYYKANMSTSGIEVRFNGRVMKYNIFEDVWGTEKHNSYNNFLVIIDLETDNPDMLPGTTTSKNGLNEGDKKIDALYEWIRKRMPNPIKSMSKSTSETELFNELKKNKEQAFSHSSSKPTISVEQRVWHCISQDERVLPRIDLYECTVSGDVNVYEGKYNKTDSQDVYQLKMYWDGLISDGTTPTCGILVADEHPEWVEELVAETNKQTDSTGKNYNFVLDTWQNLGVK